MVRHRELGKILPLLSARNIHTQLVTSAVRPIPQEWSMLRRLQIVVSVDGLPEEHDKRRAPATYERILRHIAGHQVTVHCTVTRQQVQRDGYLEDRSQVLADLRRLRSSVPKLEIHAGALDVYAHPPTTPADCTFARTTECVSADFARTITPCQLGGNPDCSNCGCIASASLEAIGRHHLVPGIAAREIFSASLRIGESVATIRNRRARSAPRRNGAPKTRA